MGWGNNGTVEMLVAWIGNKPSESNLTPQMECFTNYGMYILHVHLEKSPWNTFRKRKKGSPCNCHLQDKLEDDIMNLLSITFKADIYSFFFFYKHLVAF